MSALSTALNPIANATQVINRADSSTIPKKIFIFLAYVVALFPTESISNERTCDESSRRCGFDNRPSSCKWSKGLILHALRLYIVSGSDYSMLPDPRVGRPLLR